MNTKEYDLLVLGSSPGGNYFAWALAKQGQRVAVIEKKYIGGSCPNIACLPSKNIIHSAKIASYFQRSQEFGLRQDDWHLDMTGVRDRKRKMVNDLLEVHLSMFKESGAELIEGFGSFVGPKTIKVSLSNGTTQTLHGKNIVVSTGSHATIPPTPGLLEAKPLTHIEALELDRVPEHLIVIGGGYIGLELAQAIRRFGARVTIVEKNERLLHREDEDISAALHETFHDEGIDILTRTTITRVEGKSSQSIKVHIVRDESETVLEGTHLLVATGRTPNTKDIGLELAGVKQTDRGYIQVNERLETTAPDVWAMGECAGSPQFTHIAFDDFRVVLDRISGGHRTTAGRQIPFCMFTDPELARIGLDQSQAKTRKIPYRLMKIPMAEVLRTRTLSEMRGFMKALIDPKSDRILGFTAFGVGAGELLASVQVAMIAHLPYTALRDAIFSHPTLSEGLNSLFSAPLTDII